MGTELIAVWACDCCPLAEALVADVFGVAAVRAGPGDTWCDIHGDQPDGTACPHVQAILPLLPARGQPS